MPRIPFANLKKADGFAIEILNQISEKVGRIPNVHRVLAHSPAALGGLVELEKRLRGGALEPTIRELAALEVARLVGDEGARKSREESAARAGVDSRKITDLAAADRSEAYTPRERAMLRYANEWIRCEGPSEGALAGLAIHFTHPQTIELSLAVGLEFWLARLCRDFRIEEGAEAAASAEKMRSCGA